MRLAETAIGIAIGAVVLGFMIGPRVRRSACGSAPVGDLRRFAIAAGELAAYHGACPSHEAAARRAHDDGRRTLMYACTIGLRGATIAVAWPGHDGRAGTPDDVIVVRAPD